MDVLTNIYGIADHKYKLKWKERKKVCQIMINLLPNFKTQGG
jgi:hypothetical protein